MLDVNNLMRGNLIMTKDGVIEIGKIHRESIADKWGSIYFDNEIEGIEVTEEILRKIGFSKQEQMGVFELVHFFRYWDKDYRYKLDVHGGPNNSGRKWYVHIDNGDCCTIGCGEFDYVHELQNLVRINCKEDLPITKEVFDGLGNDA